MADATTENTTNTDTSPTAQKYGFDLVYDPNSEEFLIQRDSSEYMSVIDRQAWDDKYLRDMIETFSPNAENLDSADGISLFEALQVKEPEILHENRDLYAALQAEKPDLSLASYNQDNSITFYHYSVAPEEREACIELLQTKKNLTPERAALAFDKYTNDEAYARFSQKLHEKSHLGDHLKSGDGQYNIHPEYMARLDALTEIKAALRQAGDALEQYNTSGNPDAFDGLSTKLEAENIKNALRENPNMANKEDFVAQYVHDKWLKVYNQGGSDYSRQMYNNSSPQKIDYPLWALDKSPAAHQEYLARVESMFAEDIPGLGNVRKFINPDFPLNDDLAQQLENDCALTLDNKSLHAMAENGKLGEYFEQTKEAYADGILTRKEEKKLNNFVQKNAKMSPEATKKFLELSGRLGNSNPSVSADEQMPLEMAPTNSQQSYDIPQPAQEPQQPTVESQQQKIEPQQPTLTASPQLATPSAEQTVTVPLKMKELSSSQQGYFITNWLRQGKDWNNFCETQNSAKTASNSALSQTNTISAPQIIKDISDIGR